MTGVKFWLPDSVAILHINQFHLTFYTKIAISLSEKKYTCIPLKDIYFETSCQNVLLLCKNTLNKFSMKLSQNVKAEPGQINKTMIWLEWDFGSLMTSSAYNHNNVWLRRSLYPLGYFNVLCTSIYRRVRADADGGMQHATGSSIWAKIGSPRCTHEPNGLRRKEKPMPCTRTKIEP